MSKLRKSLINNIMNRKYEKKGERQVYGLQIVDQVDIKDVFCGYIFDRRETQIQTTNNSGHDISENKDKRVGACSPCKDPFLFVEDHMNSEVEDDIFGQLLKSNQPISSPKNTHTFNQAHLTSELINFVNENQPEWDDGSSYKKSINDRSEQYGTARKTQQAISSMQYFSNEQSVREKTGQLEVGIEQKNRQQKIRKIQITGCNCRKSKCLKMYCECFLLQIFCNPNCNCCDCHNHQNSDKHQQAVIEALSRNPKAFANIGESKNSFAASVSHLKGDTRGCTCKKTKCNKKYCDCFAAGIKCGIFCKCSTCQNC